MLKSSSLCLYSSNLGTFWLKIEQFWPFEEISIFSNGGHLGYRTALTDTILKGDHLRIISAKFGSVVSEQKIFFTFHPPFFYFLLRGHLGWKSGSPDTILEGGHPRIIPQKFGCNWPSGF
jgi:hypothetical protein